MYNPGSKDSERSDMLSYDLVVVLTGGTRINEAGKHVPTTEHDNDGNGMLAGGWRSMAAAVLHLDGTAERFLVSGGKSKKQAVLDGPGIPYAAHVYGDAMRHVINQEGMDGAAAEIGYEIDSPNTVKSLGNIQRMLADTTINRVGVLTSRYHIPRTRGLFDLAHGTWNEHIRLPDVEYLEAEDIVLGRWPGLEGDIVRAYGSPLGVQRIRNEQQGVADIQAGRYVLGELVEGLAA